MFGKISLGKGSIKFPDLDVFLAVACFSLREIQLTISINGMGASALEVASATFRTNYHHKALMNTDTL